MCYLSPLIPTRQIVRVGCTVGWCSWSKTFTVLFQTTLLTLNEPRRSKGKTEEKRMEKGEKKRDGNGSEKMRKKT